MSFQEPDNAVCGMDKQKTLLDILQGKEKVYTKAMEKKMRVRFFHKKEYTPNQQSVLKLCKELDEAYAI